MKIFSFNSKSGNQQLKITEDDRHWVEENFRWLKEVFGYPNRAEEQILLTPKSFPATFSSETVTVGNILDDLCKLFGISRESLKHEMLTDLRDYNNIPYQIEGRPFECETQLKKGDYTIFIANNLLNHPNRLSDFPQTPVSSFA